MTQVDRWNTEVTHFLSPQRNEYEPASLHIVGSRGKLGRDLGKIARLGGIDIHQDPDFADYIALCTPSHIASENLKDNAYKGKTIIDLSGAAKKEGVGQYGLMTDSDTPWKRDFDPHSDIYSNPGCIAGAVIKGLGLAGLKGISQPEALHIVSIGGQTHAADTLVDDITLARRLHEHPHVREIEEAFQDTLRVASFMPTICDTPQGLLVTVSGSTKRGEQTQLHPGYEQLSVSDATGTNTVRHRLEVREGRKKGKIDFSLGIAIDNLRFVSHNAVHLIKYLQRSR